MTRATRGALCLLFLLGAAGVMAAGLPSVHHARRKAVDDWDVPSHRGPRSILLATNRRAPDEDAYEDDGGEDDDDYDDWGDYDAPDSHYGSRVDKGGPATHAADTASEHGRAERGGHHGYSDEPASSSSHQAGTKSTLDLLGGDGDEDRDQDGDQENDTDVMSVPRYTPSTGISQEGAAANNNKGENPVDEITRREAMRDMHKYDEKMKAAAKAMDENAHAQVEEAKAATEAVAEGDASVTSTSVPKGEGNVIITNKTHAAHRDPRDEVDPLKALRAATESLFQRARHKNLPVGEDGDLTTPEQIYQALNRLEYTIDVYRDSQLESPNPDLNISADDKDDDAAAAADARFMQTRSKGRQRSSDEDDDDDGDDGDADDDDDDDYMDDADEGDETEEVASKAAAREKGAGGGTKANEKAQPKLSPEQALHALGATVTELVEILNQVVAANTGIDNVLVHAKTEPPLQVA